MYAQPPPEPPPAITVQQQEDLGCVSIGLLFGGGANGIRGGWNSRMARFYLGRLQVGDNSRDWRALVRPVPADMPYREFMERMAECRARMPAPRIPTPPAQPTSP